MGLMKTVPSAPSLQLMRSRLQLPAHNQPAPVRRLTHAKGKGSRQQTLDQFELVRLLTMTSPSPALLMTDVSDVFLSCVLLVLVAPDFYALTAI